MTSLADLEARLRAAEGACASRLVSYLIALDHDEVHLQKPLSQYRREVLDAAMARNAALIDILVNQTRGDA